MVLTYILKVYPLRFYWEKIYPNHYLRFSFKKHVSSQVFKDFSAENLETTLSNFFSKCFSEIYLSPIINYWGRIFILYLTRGVFSLVCAVSVFFSVSFSSFFFFFLLVFSLTDTNDSQDSRDGRGNHCFFCFPLPTDHGHSFSSLRFLPLLLSQSICNYQTDS